MYGEDKFYVKWERGYNRVHIGDPQLRCGPIPDLDIRNSEWKGPFDTLEEAKDAVDNIRTHNCRICFNSSSYEKPINAISTPMGGQPGYRSKYKRRG